MNINLKTYLKSDNIYTPIGDAETVVKLPPAIYETWLDPQSGKIYFEEISFNHDELVDLPGTAYDQVMGEIDTFFLSSTKNRFNDVGLLHKMNILLFGTPGAGKTMVVNRVAKKIIKDQGIVLFNPNPEQAQAIFQVLDKLQADTQVLVVFEELDQLIEQYGEKNFLNLLDGEVQKKNAMFIGTTNYYNEIPVRIKRPGRFALRIEVGLPGAEARYAYLNSKLKNPSLSKEIGEATAGFSVDNLKDVIRASYCMGKDHNKVIADLRKEFDITKEGSSVLADAAAEDSQETDEDQDGDNSWLTGLKRNRNKRRG